MSYMIQSLTEHYGYVLDIRVLQNITDMSYTIQSPTEHYWYVLDDTQSYIKLYIHFRRYKVLQNITDAS